MEERLKIEECEREARRKRVEAIMLRTRAKGSIGNQTKVGYLDLYVNIVLRVNFILLFVE